MCAWCSGGSVRIVRYSGESTPVPEGTATFRGRQLEVEIFGGRHTAELVTSTNFFGFCTDQIMWMTV